MGGKVSGDWRKADRLFGNDPAGLDESARGIVVLVAVGLLVGVLSGMFGIGGGTVIGRDSVIGSNVFITHSIPPCTTVSVKSQELQFKPRNCEGNCASCTKPEPFWEGQK